MLLNESFRDEVLAEGAEARKGVADLAFGKKGQVAIDQHLLLREMHVVVGVLPPRERFTDFSNQATHS